MDKPDILAGCKSKTATARKAARMTTKHRSGCSKRPLSISMAANNDGPCEEREKERKKQSEKEIEFDEEILSCNPRGLAQ